MVGSFQTYVSKIFGKDDFQVVCKDVDRWEEVIPMTQSSLGGSG